MVYQVDLLKNKLGFDEAFNYNDETDLVAALKRSVNFSMSSQIIKNRCKTELPNLEIILDGNFLVNFSSN